MSKKRLPKPLIALLIIVFISAGYYFSIDKNVPSTYYGELEPNTFDIYSLANGIITEINVSEGDSIAIGNIVAKIDSDEAILKDEKSTITKEISETQLKKAASPARYEEINIQLSFIDQLKNQKSSIDSSIEKVKLSYNQSMKNSNTLQSTYDLKTKIYNDTKALYDVGSESKTSLDLAEVALTEAKNAYESSLIQSDAIKKEIDSLISQSSSIDSQINAAKEKLNILSSGADINDRIILELNDELAKIDTEVSKIYLDRYSVKSYIEGTVDSINYDVGEYINIGAPIMTIYNPNKISTKLYVREKDLLNIHIGMELEFSLSSDPNIVINGVIKKISNEAIFTPMNVVIEKDRDRLVFEVEVDLDPVSGIKPGMLVKTNIN